MTREKSFLETVPIRKLLIKLTVPAMTGMLANALYNLVDTIFIGRGVGTLGIAAIAIALPVQMMMVAIAMLVGFGAGSMLSRSLGAKNYEQVHQITGNAFLAIIVFGIVLAGTGIIFTGPIVRLFGATEAIAPLAKDYLQILFFGVTYFPFTMVSHNLIRAEGGVRYVMRGMLIGFGANILLDYVFIFPLGMGIAGAAWATLIGKFLNFVYIFAYLRSDKTALKIQWHNLIPQLRIFTEMFSIGVSGFAMQIVNSSLIIVLNHLLGTYGDWPIAVYGIIHKVNLFMALPLVGIRQGMAPIAGYNFGAGLFRRVNDAIRNALAASLLLAITMVVLVELFPAEIFSIFTKDSNFITQGAPVLRITISMMWLVGIRICGVGVFQALGKAVPALILSVLRQLLLFLPLILLLPKVNGLGLWGIWLAFPIADFFGTGITGLMLSREMRQLKQMS